MCLKVMDWPPLRKNSITNPLFLVECFPNSSKPKTFKTFKIFLRTVLLLWGVNKFTKKLREADPIPTNEIDNLVRYLTHRQFNLFRPQLRRVPDCELLEDCRDVSSPQQSSQPSSP